MKNILMILLAVGLFSVRANAGTNDTTVVFKTSVLCDMCKERIERELVFEKGVREVKVDVKAKTVQVVFRKDKNNTEKLKKAISKLGYRADNITADPKAFKKLPACCREEGCGKD